MEELTPFAQQYHTNNSNQPNSLVPAIINIDSCGLLFGNDIATCNSDHHLLKFCAPAFWFILSTVVLRVHQYSNSNVAFFDIVGTVQYNCNSVYAIVVLLGVLFCSDLPMMVLSSFDLSTLGNRP
jgi:hypothetical protein